MLEVGSQPLPTGPTSESQQPAEVRATPSAAILYYCNIKLQYPLPSLLHSGPGAQEPGSAPRLTMCPGWGRRRPLFASASPGSAARPMGKDNVPQDPARLCPPGQSGGAGSLWRHRDRPRGQSGSIHNAPRRPCPGNRARCGAAAQTRRDFSAVSSGAARRAPGCSFAGARPGPAIPPGAGPAWAARRSGAAPWPCAAPSRWETGTGASCSQGRGTGPGCTVCTNPCMRPSS